MRSSSPLLPGCTLGVMGGGQLGRMFVQAAQRMGYRTVVLDPDVDSPAGRVSETHLQFPYLSPEGLQRLAAMCDAITTEFENVPSDALAQLAQQRPVAPGAEAVAIAQDRAREKAHFLRCGVPVAPHQVIHSSAELSSVKPELFPGILKTTRMGYDGKGQVRVAQAGDLERAWQALQGTAHSPVTCVLEKMLPLAAECSVIVARGSDGQQVHLPVQRNLHREGILAVTEVFPEAIDPEFSRQAIAAAQAVAAGLNYVGVLCVEFFLLAPGAEREALGPLVVNEMAPRPHNSGHYSQDACDVSQFELQVRCMAGLPLTPPRLHSPALMLNLLGDLWFSENSASPQEPPWAKVLALPGTHLHLYGKTSARRGRKMGHLNITGDCPETVRATAQQAATLLGIAPF